MTQLTGETELILLAIERVEKSLAALVEGQGETNERLRKAENRIVALNVAVFGVGVWAIGYLMFTHLVK